MDTLPENLEDELKRISRITDRVWEALVQDDASEEIKLCVLGICIDTIIKRKSRNLRDKVFGRFVRDLASQIMKDEEDDEASE